MSNKLSSNPMFIDTGGTGILCKGRISIRRIEFTGYQTITDNAVIQDAAGNPIWQTRGDSNFDAQFRNDLGQYDGVQVPTLDSGFVLIYYN